jgi:hypothetical protein
MPKVGIGQDTAKETHKVGNGDGLTHHASRLSEGVSSSL